MRTLDDDEFTLPPPSEPNEVWAAKTHHEPGTTVTVTGRLGFDDIEVGCAFLETPGGIRYEVIYPDDWTLDRACAELRGPGQLAHAGDLVTVQGVVATDRSSICQIGPIFVATDVKTRPA